MTDLLAEYKAGREALPAHNRLWPLYGAGLENLGRDGRTIDTPLPEPGPDELLVRHDACGLCFSDIKIIAQGPAHPRIRGRDMRKDPVVMGHEVAITVVKVGEKLQGQYEVGDRFIIQADIYKDGVNYAYGYLIQGGFSWYGLIDQRVLNGDHGNYLIPMKPETGYAESALAEPWACVVAAYILQYRTALKRGGAAWFIGTPRAKPSYTISQGFTRDHHPAQVFLTGVPPQFAAYVRKLAAQAGAEVREVPSVDALPVAQADDIVLLGADAELIEKVSPKLGAHGIMALMDETPLARPVQVDVGRIHYERWAYVGAKGTDIAAAYAQTPVRSKLKPRGRCLFVGAGGPIGRMHVQRAIQLADGPATIVCTDAADPRLKDLHDTFASEASAKGIRFLCVNPTRREEYQTALQAACGQMPVAGRRPGGSPLPPQFDDIIVLAPVAAAISETSNYLAPGGVMNIFAGVVRGTQAAIDLSSACLKQARVIGHSASSIDDLREVLRLVESGQLSTNRSVAAIGSLSATKDGLKATQEARYPGKIVVYPHIKELPLTAVPDLKERLPSVYAKLRNGREWTLEAEEELLRVMLPGPEERAGVGQPQAGGGAEVF